MAIFPDIRFVLLEMLCVFLFFTAAGVFVITLARGIGQRNRNAKAPRLSIPATVVAKRTDVSGHKRAVTTYYVTFEADNGVRAEFAVDGARYGVLVEGDAGTLTFQGTRYLGFERS